MYYKCIMQVWWGIINTKACWNVLILWLWAMVCAAWDKSVLKPKFHYRVCWLCDFHRNFPAGKVADTSHESPQHKSCRWLSWFVSLTLLPTFSVYCNGLNSIRVTQTGLSRTLSQTSRHVEMVCVRDFPQGEVLVKVSVMEFGLKQN